MSEFFMGFVLFALFADYLWVKMSQDSRPRQWPKARNPFYIDE